MRNNLQLRKQLAPNSRMLQKIRNGGNLSPSPILAARQQRMRLPRRFRTPGPITRQMRRRKSLSATVI